MSAGCIACGFDAAGCPGRESDACYKGAFSRAWDGAQERWTALAPEEQSARLGASLRRLLALNGDDRTSWQRSLDDYALRGLMGVD